jgi:PKD repeat protein
MIHVQILNVEKMKTKILLFAAFLSLQLANVKAQTAGVLHGTLIDNYLNYNPTPNHEVKLKTYNIDSLGFLNVVHVDSTISDSLGAFSFNTFVGVNNYHELSIIDCNGLYVSQSYFSSPGSTLFIETCNNSSSCSATLSFVIDSTNSSTVHFSCPELANASSYTIHYGDGTSSSNSLTHNYATNDLIVGVYASISIVFQNGCVGYGYAFVMNVNQVNCYSHFSYQQMGVSNDIQFTSSASSNNVSYLWDFGDGTTDTTANPIHTYVPNQNYLVSLTTTDQTGCNYSSHAMIYVYDICGVNITSYQMFDTTLTVQFYALSNFYQAIDSNSSITWNFGDGSPTDTTFYPIHTYTTVGTYNVCLNVVSNSGCNTNTCSNVTVYDYTYELL